MHDDDDVQDIDPFETMYDEMDEDSFHQMMEGNDWTYYPLFSDKEFLNEDWHKYTCIESCAAIGNARHGCESLGTDIQSIREIDDSGSTLVSEIGNMMTNITGSSILKSTGHTSQVKPGKLSVRFILSDRFERTFDSKQSEVVSTDESEIGIVSESEDDWYSCESSDDEDEYFPELNETHLCEGKLKNKDSVSQLRILSNMMGEETHVDSTSSGEQADI